MLTLSDVLDDDRLLEMAGDRSFQRGVNYFHEGRVQSLAQYDEHITAKVYGTATYQVHLWLEEDERDDLHYRCNCPVGVEGDFCKHAVATALAWIAEPPPFSPGPEEESARKPTSMQDVRDYLNRQEHDTLIKLILDRAMEDDRWRDQLLLKVAAQQAGGPDLHIFRRALRSAIATGDFVDYYAADSYAEAVEDVINSLEELLEEGYASAVVELCEEAIELLEEAINSVDDSNGCLSPVMDQVQDLHYRACEIARPNPQALAQRLFEGELRSGFGFFSNALETYAEILGEAGLAAYGQLVDAAWSQLPRLDHTNAGNFDYHRSQLNRMKEALVAATGNLADLVAVIATDLSQPSRYLHIAELYQQAHQPELAITWAERGLAAFQSSYSTHSLRNFLVAAYADQGRMDEAADLVGEEFCRHPSLPLYQQLKQQAEQAQSWPQWRERAIAHLEATAAPPQSFHRFNPTGTTLLVDIFLWEGDADQAWQVAQTKGCLPHQKIRLADLRAAHYPEDALSVYLPAVEPLINETKNESYQQAVELLVKIKALMGRLHRQAEFEQMVATLKTTYKRKRNFIQYLQQATLIG